jgi:hypothetical protein
MAEKLQALFARTATRITTIIDLQIRAENATIKLH